MARQVLPWVGMAIGSMVGAPQIGFMVGSLIGNAIDPQVINGPKLGEGQDNQASEGGYRPIVLGKGAVGVCLIHEGPLKKRPIRHKQSKGGGPVTTEERAYRTMAFALGESAYPDTGVVLTRLWIDNKLRYDVTPTSQITQESADFANEFTFYPGDNNQQPDPDLEAFMGAGNVPSYRGGAPYIVFPDWDVTDSRGMAPMIKAEIVSAGTAGGDTLIAFGTALGTLDGIFRVIPPDWTGAWENPVGNEIYSPASMFAGSLSGGRVVYWGGLGMVPCYTDDFGQTFVVSTGFPGSSAASLPWSHGSTVVIPRGSSNIAYKSSDRGETFTIVSDSSRLYAVGAVQGPVGVRWIGVFSGPAVVNLRISDDNASSFGSIQYSFTGGEGAPTIESRFSNGSRFFFGGKKVVSFSPALNEPALYSTLDGVNVSEYALPTFAAAESVTAICERNGVIVVGTDSGEIAYYDNGQWHVSDDLFGARCNDLIHNGIEFVMIGSAAITPGDAFIKSSNNGVRWTTRVSGSVGFGNYWGAIATAQFAPASSQKILLSSIIGFLHERVGLPPDKANTAQLNDLVEGIVFSDGYTAADAIRTQMALYFFDAGEFDAGSGYRLNYVKRGGPASVTLTEADIVDGPEDWEREDSYERPRALHVAYQNPVTDYGAPNITIKRTSPDVLVVGERSASVPNVFSDVDEITQRSDIMMTVIYSEIAGTYDITLPVSWLELAPTDCVGFSIRGRTRRLRLTNWRFSPDGTIKTEWMADRQSAYTSNVTGLPVVPPTPPPPSIVGPTVSAVLDIPALVDALDSLHVVLAASGQTEAWYGSIHQRKLPSDADYATMAQFSAPTTIMGTLQIAVSAASPHYTDTTNVVRVKLYSDDDLDTYTQQQFLSEHGAFALAWDDGGMRRWEVCQYRDAVKVGDMEWELTTLLRGRLNTEAEDHPIGSLFVLLDSGIRVAPAQSSWIEQDITHRAVSNGQLPDNAVPYVETYTGESQREWPVAHVLLDLVGDNLTVDIVPRHRFGTDDHPVRSLNWDGYRIEATDGVNSATMTSASDTDTIDVTGWSGTITVTVAQLNRITGAGPTVSETIEA